LTNAFFGPARRSIYAAILVAALACMARAQTPSPSPSPSPSHVATPAPIPTPTPADASGDDNELLSLLKVLNEETAVATKTRMNGDYVPGIVTVLHGEEMAALGARTVWDALALVPGIEAVRDVSGVPSVTVRGLQFPFNSGNVKVLVDSMPGARDNAGINSIILDIPIQLVDRIEVIRGPGSVVYGDFAYMGLIHIITRKSGRGAYARAEDGSAFSLGGFGGGRTRGGMEYSLSGTAFTGGPTEVPSNRKVDDTRAFAFGSLKYRGFSLSGDVATRQIKDGTGLLQPVRGQQTHRVVEARYAHDVSSTTRIDVRLNDRRNRYRATAANLDGDVQEAGASLQWSGARRQAWLFDASFTRSHIDRAVFPDPVPPAGAGPPATPGSPPPPLPPLGFVVQDENLAFVSLMAQDTIEASSRLAFTLGARFDRYGDVDTRITPRASVVFRASDRNILKLQYAEGFRAPTFFELYSRGPRHTNLDFEVNRTIEVNFVHRRPGTVARLTAYHSRLDDLIFVLGADAQRHSIFENARKARVHGVEAELERELGRRLKVVGNVSWFKTKDSRNVANLYAESTSVPDYLANFALIAAPASKTQVSARWHYVAKRGTAVLPAYSEFQATVTRKGIAIPGLDLRAGVRFSRGRGVVYPHILPNVLNAVPYRFPRAFAEVSWSR
jgi:outer membrane receptor for ferrienterochelin and colicins